MVKLSNSNLQMSLFTGDRICELFGIYSPSCTKEPGSLTPSTANVSSKKLSQNQHC